MKTFERTGAQYLPVVNIDSQLVAISLELAFIVCIVSFVADFSAE